VTIVGTLPNPAALPIPALAPIVTQLNALLRATAAGANSVEPLREVTYQAWLPKAGITWDMSRDLGLSFTVQRGYRAGGSGLNQQRAQAYTFDPEYTWNYELALRSQWFDRRLSVNANAFWIDWKDQQVSVQLTPGAVFDTQVINAGRSRLYGFEFDVQGRLTRTLSLYAGLGYSNTRFQEFDVSLGQLFSGAVGNEFADAPRWTLSGGGTWQHPAGWFVNVNANYRSAFYQNTQTQLFRDIKARTIVNTKLGWQNAHVGAYLFVSNIFDVQKPTSFFDDFDGRRRGQVSDPRLVGLSLEGRF
jgi:outer membrane receptor protein involved in Fe transport